jgi:hypothetical protein
MGELEYVLVSSRGFIEPDVYDEEFKQTFTRCWLSGATAAKSSQPAISSPPTWLKTRSWSHATAADGYTPSSTSAAIAAANNAAQMAASFIRACHSRPPR